jgi:tRNA pseudouridine13 synthase
METQYLTADIPGTGGRLKLRPEDFVVDEIPLYEPCGTGTHSYFRIRKVGLTTPAAIDRLARLLGVSPAVVGAAGMKDAQAVTTQTLSVEHVDGERLQGFDDGKLTVLTVSRHGNKLKTGHLRGNRFSLKIRAPESGSLAPSRPWAEAPATSRPWAEAPATSRPWAEAPATSRPWAEAPATSRPWAEGAAATASGVLSVLERRGVPNLFGVQRFGARGDTAALGAALASDDADRFLSLFLGGPKDGDPPDCRRARQHYDAGELDAALDAWPRNRRDERAALSVRIRTGDAGRAAAAVDRRMSKLYVSAFQSLLFNEILETRLPDIDRLMVGDLAQKTDTGGVFAVCDLDAEQPRCDAFAISPTGPIFGARCNLADGEPGRREREVMALHGIPEGQLKKAMGMKLPGGRRALRFRIEGVTVEPGSDDAGPFVAVSFSAPSGCYATVVLSEIMKTGV